MSEDFQNQNPDSQIAIQNVQSQKDFWRRIKHSKDYLVFESSTGGAVKISVKELWAAAEQADPKLVLPII